MCRGRTITGYAPFFLSQAFTSSGEQYELGTQSSGQGLPVLGSLPAHRTWYRFPSSARISMTSQEVPRLGLGFLRLLWDPEDIVNNYRVCSRSERHRRI